MEIAFEQILAQQHPTTIVHIIVHIASHGIQD